MNEQIKRSFLTMAMSTRRTDLRDVLARIHSHPSNSIDELLPRLWRPA